MLKFSASYLEKQKKYYSLYFLCRCQYQNKKKLFTDTIFSEGFGPPREFCRLYVGYSNTNYGVSSPEKQN